MRLSILITNRDYGRYLAQAIQSCLDQLRDGDEVVVVDDGSTDDSLDVCRAFGCRIQLIAKVNGGQASAWNAGFAVAQGDALCLLDADDVFLPGKLDAVRQSFEQGAQWCFHPLMPVGPSLEALPRTGGAARIPSPGALAAALARGRMPYLPTATSGMSFHRTLADRLLPMPEEAGITLSDNYLKFRAVAAAPGVFLDRCWSQQRLHLSNRYTGHVDRRSRAAVIGVATAWHLQRSEPALSHFARRLFIDAASELVARQGSRAWTHHPLALRFARAHLHPSDRFEVAVRAWCRRTWHRAHAGASPAPSPEGARSGAWRGEHG